VGKQRRHSFWLLASGFWLLASGFCPLASGFWLLASGFWLLASALWLLASGFWLLASGFWLLPFGFCPLASALCLLPFVVSSRAGKISPSVIATTDSLLTDNGLNQFFNTVDRPDRNPQMMGEIFNRHII
jgi:hypothetical protein